MQNLNTITNHLSAVWEFIFTTVLQTFTLKYMMVKIMYKAPLMTVKISPLEFQVTVLL